jgi:hypothetical protein
MWNDQEFNSILTVVCYIIKYMLFISTHEAFTVIEFAKLFFEHVECCFKISRDIIINRNLCIISKFWQEIYKIQIIKKHMFTVYHSQTNDQNKVLNYIMKDYLHVYNAENQFILVLFASLAHCIYKIVNAYEQL